MKMTMKTKVNIEDILLVLYWVKVHSTFEHKNFNFDSLLQQAESYSYTNTPLDITIHRIDELVIEAYHIYHKLKITSEKMEMVLDQLNMDKEMILGEGAKYEKVFENLIENYKYDDPEVVGIQIGMLTEKMNESIEVEDYEGAATYRDKIKECR